jgi:hypothetical protein
VISTGDSDQTFGAKHFGSAELGDARRTKRLISSVDAICRHPGGTLPDKFRSPKDLKAFYRLCDCDQVTHEVVLSAHREVVLQDCRDDVLILHDSTELDYTKHLALEDLGQIGNGSRRGYICHNSLAVNAQSREVIGLTNQVLHRRTIAPTKETPAQRRERESRESRLWLKGVEPLPNEHRFIDVCDQGADTFEFLAHECASGRRFVIRAAYDRAIFIGHDASKGKSGHLRQYASQLPILGQHTVTVTSKLIDNSPKKHGKRSKDLRTGREATVAVSAAPVLLKPPQKKAGEYPNEPLAVWIIRVWELNPPKGEERLEWFLLTNEPITTYEDARRAIGWYECRWIIEEYHKALKTGCWIESPQFNTEERLQPAIAILSVIALTLLKLRDASRRPDAKERPATTIVSKEYVEVLSLWRHKRVCLDWSVHDFFFALARLGGHQNRKSDKRPGWLILWRGWTSLQAMVDGAMAIQLLERCG